MNKLIKKTGEWQGPVEPSPKPGTPVEKMFHVPKAGRGDTFVRGRDSQTGQFSLPKDQRNTPANKRPHSK